MSIKG